MNKKLSSLGWLTLLLPFFSIGLVHAAAGLSFGDEVREVQGFHAIANSGSIDVEVHFGDRESVRLVGDDAAIREVETKVENGTLEIGFKKGSWKMGRNWGKVTAHVTAKRLDGIKQSGSGNVTVSGILSGNELSAALSGSGRITFESDVQVFNGAISGSGRITAAGDATESNISISGSGRFDGGELKSQSANLKISGSGNITIHTDKQLDASISGSGNVNYSGNAQTNVRTSGSGRLRKI
ncbi:head GIN domain-containing protein [Parapedobacter koreensis]|uniref:Putative auto-transporter adhesin, head GIN domain n=1 Tax=Parapedobacter koreensis TaxID=332977 RepID=A0A1H7JAA6_9SPHI|nr:head GIN domain-containing protein [Parapedobacter koreensis]SEK70225.1 Putative auto-transporter adhesin, head GIN domain [Parapedobacter koreensis]